MLAAFRRSKQRSGANILNPELRTLNPSRRAQAWTEDWQIQVALAAFQWAVCHCVSRARYTRGRARCAENSAQGIGNQRVSGRFLARGAARGEVGPSQYPATQKC